MTIFYFLLIHSLVLLRMTKIGNNIYRHWNCYEYRKSEPSFMGNFPHGVSTIILSPTSILQFAFSDGIHISLRKLTPCDNIVIKYHFFRVVYTTILVAFLMYLFSLIVRNWLPFLGMLIYFSSVYLHTLYLLTLILIFLSILYLLI